MRSRSPGEDFTLSRVCHKNGTIDTWCNEVPIHTNQAIASAGDIELKHAVIAFLGLIVEEGANIDDVVVETLGASLRDPGRFRADSFDLADIGGGVQVAACGVASTNGSDIAFVLFEVG